MGVVRARAAATKSTAASVARRVASRLALREVDHRVPGTEAESSPLLLDPDVADAVERLRKLRERDLLTEHEFEVTKARIGAP